MFVLPENHQPINKKTGEELSVFTVKTYKSKLNKLAKRGYTDVDELLENQEEIVAAMNKEIPGDTSKDRYKRRVFLSAIFFAIGSKTVDEIPHFYAAFQKAKDNYIPPIPLDEDIAVPPVKKETPIADAAARFLLGRRRRE